MTGHTSQTKYVERAKRMLEIFKKHGGDCEAPMELSDDVNYPAPLKALLQVCSEWHTLPEHKHHDVFGLNLFDDGEFFDKIGIIAGDDEELMDEWKEDRDTPNCAEDGWECFGAVSEYDFLFVNIDPNSEHFGKTRRIVNNCWEDEPMTNTFHEFFDKLEAFTQQWNEDQDTCAQDAFRN